MQGTWAEDTGGALRWSPGTEGGVCRAAGQAQGSDGRAVERQTHAILYGGMDLSLHGTDATLAATLAASSSRPPGAHAAAPAQGPPPPVVGTRYQVTERQQHGPP